MTRLFRLLARLGCLFVGHNPKATWPDVGGVVLVACTACHKVLWVGRLESPPEPRTVLHWKANR